jgi:hypothetical protein
VTHPARVALLVVAALSCAVACGTDNNTPEPASEEPVVTTELTENLALCSNRTPMSAFQQEALPWFTANADQATAALITRVQDSGGSTERAAIALGQLGAEQAVPALEGAVMSDVITHQAAASRALWAIPGAQSDAALARVVADGGSPAKRVLQALEPHETRSPCGLIAQAASLPELADAAQTARERCGC